MSEATGSIFLSTTNDAERTERQPRRSCETAACTHPLEKAKDRIFLGLLDARRRWTCFVAKCNTQSVHR